MHSVFGWPSAACPVSIVTCCPCHRPTCAATHAMLQQRECSDSNACAAPCHGAEVCHGQQFPVPAAVQRSGSESASRTGGCARLTSSCWIGLGTRRCGARSGTQRWRRSLGTPEAQGWGLRLTPRLGAGVLVPVLRPCVKSPAHRRLRDEDGDEGGPTRPQSTRQHMHIVVGCSGRSAISSAASMLVLTLTE